MEQDVTTLIPEQIRKIRWLKYSRWDDNEELLPRKSVRRGNVDAGRG
jgi:hypothetical protein